MMDPSTQLPQMLVQLDADITPLQRSLALAERAADQSVGRMTSLGDKLGESLTQAAAKGKSLGDVLRALALDLAKLVWQQTVSAPLTSVLGSVLGGIFGRATGGSVSSQTPYLVGEQGPELFIPSAAGRVASASETVQAGGDRAGVSVSIAIDARGAEAGAADKLKRVADDIQARTFSAVFAAMERGGRYARISGRR